MKTTTTPPPGRTNIKTGESDVGEALCPQCFPDGWPPEVTSVGCEHGTWTTGPPK